MQRAYLTLGWNALTIAIQGVKAIFSTLGGVVATARMAGCHDSEKVRLWTDYPPVILKGLIFPI